MMPAQLLIALPDRSHSVAKCAAGSDANARCCGNGGGASSYAYCCKPEHFCCNKGYSLEPTQSACCPVRQLGCKPSLLMLSFE